MNFNAIQYSDGNLWALPEWPEKEPELWDFDSLELHRIKKESSIKSRVEFKPGDFDKVVHILFGIIIPNDEARANWISWQKEGEVYPLPDGYRIHVQEYCSHESCPVDAGCEHCKEPKTYALLLPIREEHDPCCKGNFGHWCSGCEHVKKHFPVGDTMQDQMMTVLDQMGLNPVKKEEQPVKPEPVIYTIVQDGSSISYYKNGKMVESKGVKSTLEFGSAKPEPTRKLVLDELIEWLKKEICFINDGDSLPDRFARQAYKDCLKQAQSLRKKEEDNMVNFAFDFYYQMSEKMEVPFDLISENRDNAYDYLTQTYKTQ
jgi:hypothetical protein